MIIIIKTFMGKHRDNKYHKYYDLPFIEIWLSGTLLCHPSATKLITRIRSHWILNLRSNCISDLCNTTSMYVNQVLRSCAPPHCVKRCEAALYTADCAGNLCNMYYTL
jgi:hypothetical protein